MTVFRIRSHVTNIYRSDVVIIQIKPVIESYQLDVAFVFGIKFVPILYVILVLKPIISTCECLVCTAIIYPCSL